MVRYSHLMFVFFQGLSLLNELHFLFVSFVYSCSCVLLQIWHILCTMSPVVLSSSLAQPCTNSSFIFFSFLFFSLVALFYSILFCLSCSTVLEYKHNNTDIQFFDKSRGQIVFIVNQFIKNAVGIRSSKQTNDHIRRTSM